MQWEKNWVDWKSTCTSLLLPVSKAPQYHLWFWDEPSPSCCLSDSVLFHWTQKAGNDLTISQEGGSPNSSSPLMTSMVWKLKKLQCVQSFFSLLTTPDSLHWLPIYKTIIIKLLITYKALNDLTPAYFSELLIHLDHEGSPLLLRVPLVNKVKYAERVCARAVSILCNGFPLVTRDNPYTSAQRQECYSCVFCWVHHANRQT